MAKKKRLTSGSQPHQRRSRKKRLPRWGLLHETFGVPFLYGFGIITFAICAVIAGYIFNQGRSFDIAGAASEHWPSTTGRIVRSDYSTRWSKRSELATLNISYTFTLTEKQYSGSTLAFEKLDSMTISEADRRLAPYPDGADCEVFYDPANPTRNVLEKGRQSGNFGLKLAAIAFFISGLFALYDGIAGAINAQRFPQRRTR